MLTAEKPKSKQITHLENKGNMMLLQSEAEKIRIIPYTDNSVRITATVKDTFAEEEKPGVILQPTGIPYTVEDGESFIEMRLPKLILSIDKATGAISYKRLDGSLLLQEQEREFEEFQSYVLAEAAETKVEKVQTADGVKELVREAARVPMEKLFHTRLHLAFSKEEGLYGLGQQEEGDLNLRGKTIYVHQANRKIAMPVLVSSLGYGIIMDTYSTMIFNDTSVGSYLYTEADREMDYYFLSGEDMNQVIGEYRRLTGKAAMLPKWAFGFIQSKERYETAQQLVETAKKHRDLQIGLDCVVLDWLSWEDGKWGQKSFDFKRFPDPAKMVQELLDLDTHFMISIWPNMDPCTENYAQMKQEGGLLKACSVYNPLDSHAREIYWEQVKKGLYQYGIRAWWCDSSEPITVEWVHKNRMEPGLMYAEYVKELSDHMPVQDINAFPLFHARTVFEGQRGESDSHRVCNLTRSAYTGQQRYGTILWSGDTAATWDTLRNQIGAGLSFVSTGLPYWTVDIGAFFVKNSVFWYWKGDYDKTTEDLGYLELYTRWYQWGAFLPVFRAHGTDCERELWEFRGGNNLFYDACLKFNRLRYQLMPYIYSQAGKVWLEDALMIKPLVFDYPKDKEVYDLREEYLFGDSILVAPVTEPMYYGPDSVKLEGSSYTKKVYLPAGNGWYDFWTNAFYEGGQWIDADASIDKMPLFVKEGSILPMGAVTQHVVKKEEITWRVYGGKDCTYTLYQDDGDGYGYEKGQYSLELYTWSETEKVLHNQSGKSVEADVICR